MKVPVSFGIPVFAFFILCLFMIYDHNYRINDFKPLSLRSSLLNFFRVITSHELIHLQLLLSNI